MESKLGSNRRPIPSRVLEKLRVERLEALKDIDPGQRMEATFALSLEVRKLFVAGLEAQGFSDAQIEEALKAKR